MKGSEDLCMPPLDRTDDQATVADHGAGHVTADSSQLDLAHLASAQSAPAKPAAVEVVTLSTGAVEEKPIAKLDAGDHTIRLSDGRQFLVHVPQHSGNEPLPAMFVFSGSAEPQYNVKDFAPESGMSQVADEDPNHPFVVVYPLAKEHLLGTGSSQPAWGWNSSGSLIYKEDRLNAGYDDIDYVKSIVQLMPTLANVDTTHKDWGAVGFSQGGVFLNKVVSTIPNLFPSVDLVGTSMQENYKYVTQPGNARNVSIVELLGDKTTLPMRGLFSESWTYRKDNLERFLLHDIKIGGFSGKRYIESDDPLAAIQNENQKPQLQNKLYIGHLGKEGKDYTVTRAHLSTPAASEDKDFEIDYQPVDKNDDRKVTVFGLTEA